MTNFVPDFTEKYRRENLRLVDDAVRELLPEWARKLGAKPNRVKLWFLRRYAKWRRLEVRTYFSHEKLATITEIWADKRLKTRITHDIKLV